MNDNRCKNIRENFEVDYRVGDLNKQDIKDLINNPIRKNYLSVCIQMLNNNLRTIFISYISEKGEISGGKRRRLLEFLEDRLENNPDTDFNKDIIKSIIPYLSNINCSYDNPCEKNLCKYLHRKKPEQEKWKVDYKDNLDNDNNIENIDCLCNGFINLLKLINDDEKQQRNFHHHLLHNCVLPVNSLTDLITLVGRTLRVRDYLRHSQDKKLPSPNIFIATIHLICILLLPSISKIFIDRLKLNGARKIWEYWNYKHRANLDIYFGLERAKKHHKKQFNGKELTKDELKKQYEKINKDSKKIARADDHWKKLHNVYTNNISEFKYWKFKKTFNYIGKEFIENIFGIEDSYNYEIKKPSFKYEIYPTYTLFTNLSFIILETYSELLVNGFDKLEILVFNDISQNEKDRLKDKYGWEKTKKGKTDRKNPFKNFDNFVNNIAHNRLWEIGLTEQMCNDILSVCVYLNRKEVGRKFIQDVLVLCKKENYKITIKDGKKLKYCVIANKYYLYRLNKEQSTEQEKLYNIEYIDNDNIEHRNFIRKITAGWNNAIKYAIKNNNFKQPKFVKTRKPTRKII